MKLLERLLFQRFFWGHFGLEKRLKKNAQKWTFSSILNSQLKRAIFPFD